MDDKTIRSVRAKVYIAFAVIALVLALMITGTTRRVVLVGVAVYSLVMSWVNFRKAKQENGNDEP